MVINSSENVTVLVLRSDPETACPTVAGESGEYEDQLEPGFILPLRRDTFYIIHQILSMAKKTSMLLPRHCRGSVVSPELHNKSTWDLCSCQLSEPSFSE